MFSCEYCKISKNTYFEEHLHTAASEVTLGNDCLGLSFWIVAFKTILSIITKIPVGFKQELYTQFSAYTLFNLGFVCSPLTVTTEKANACSPGTSC